MRIRLYKDIVHKICFGSEINTVVFLTVKWKNEGLGYRGVEKVWFVFPCVLCECG